jgi:hypothetical protein
MHTNDQCLNIPEAEKYHTVSHLSQKLLSLLPVHLGRILQQLPSSRPVI